MTILSSQLVRLMKSGAIFMLLGFIVGSQPASGQSQVKPSAPAEPVVEYPSIALRGYGTVSGSFRKAGANSLLVIDCEDEEKAKLTQAKYLSDLTTLPGVMPTDIIIGFKKLSGWKAKGQGVIAAVRSGKSVYIGAGKTEADVAAVIAVTPGGALDRNASVATVEVPMWLNRWDRYGFRFYYGAWQLPPNAKTFADYDYAQDFEFAEKMDHSGLMLWANTEDLDTAEGMTNELWWNWAMKSAAAKKLPVGLNISTGTPGRSWFFNRYRDQTIQKMPQFTGTYHAMANCYFGGTGALSWNASTAADAELGILQEIVSRAVQNPNLTSILEPHGELRHGAQDIFMEYGPVADTTFRKYLQERYTTVEALNLAWGTKFKDWNEVKVPEIASFLGWGPEAIDLRGQWRVGHEKTKEPVDRDEQGGKSFDSVASEFAPDAWFKEKFNDSSWPLVTAPGHDRTNLLPKSPAVYRQSFDVKADWLKKNPRVWLYVWDFNTAQQDTVKVVLNDKNLGEARLRRAVPHWGAYEVTDVLRAGTNQLSIRVPKGFLAYRVYLSPDEPNHYPNLGKEGNARWVDFADWSVWSRLQALRKGLEMIRQVEPNRQITLMAPDNYEDGIKELAIAYGGNFHNTGYMAAFWADSNPAIMRGARLPFSLEPGGPAGNLQDFKKFMGLWATEGLQGIDYFIHLGNVLWNPEIKKYFEEYLRLYHLIGKYHAPQAGVAALYATRQDALTGFPWETDPNINLGFGYSEWNVRAFLKGLYESDGLTESSFDSGDADYYRVVIDTNTSIMDEKLISAIERYVKDGGTFVTFVQTGRHTPVEKDAWPISRLTGYKVTHIDPITADGGFSSRGIYPAEDQTLFTGDWGQAKANGLTLEKVAPDAQNLMLWEDGSVAIGMRQIGKGCIIQIGCKFSGRSLGHHMVSGGGKATTDLLVQILKWREVPTVEANLKPGGGDNVIFRHYLSNNGLYDVWVLWNQNSKAGTKEVVEMQSGASWGFDVVTGKEISFPAGQLSVSLEAYQTRAFLTPRKNNIASAASQWFSLQRDWWRKAQVVSSEPFPKPEHRFSVDLSSDWAFKPVSSAEDGLIYSGANVEDSAWEKINLGAWSLPDKKNIKRAVLRKTFTVPESWTNGLASLSLHAWTGPTFSDEGRIWLDGKLIKGWGDSGIYDVNPEGVLIPGSKHVLAVEIRGKGSLNGSRGPAWLWFWPTPTSSQDLAGDWISSRDALTYETPMKLPGRYDAMAMRREIVVPADKADSNAVLRIRTTGRLVGAIVNGHFIRRFHHIIGERFDMNVTPWINFGKSNEIELVSMDGPASGNLSEVFLDFHDKSSYP